MEHIKTLGGQTLVYGLSSIVPRFLNYLLTPLYTHLFLPPEYGNVTILYSYVTFLNIFLTYGLETGFFYFARKERDFPKVYGTAFLSILTTTGLFALFSLLYIHTIAQWVGYSGNVRYIFWFILILSFDSLCAIPFAKLRQQNKAFRFAFIRLLSVGITVFFNLMLIWVLPHFALHGKILGFHYHLSVELIFIANFVGSLITLLILLPDIFRERITFSFPLWTRLIKYSYPLLFAGFAGTINGTLDRILLLKFLPSNVNVLAQIGIYGANIKIAVIMVLFTQMFRFAAEPFFFNQNKSVDQKLILADVTKYFAMFGILIFLFVMLYLDVLKYFIGSRYWSGLKVVPIDVMSSFLLGIYFNLSFWYKLTGKTFFGIIITFIGASITIVLNILLIPRFGYMGSAWVRLVCYLTMVTVSYFWGQKYFPVRYPLAKIFLYLAMGFLIFLICMELHSSNLLVNLIRNSVFFIGFIYFLEKREHLITVFIKK